jgi:phosphopantothenoylcysteine decarboxylase/phosphopantothenate--cysteine ligase
MNVRMWDHPATQRNIETLKQDGVRFIGPDVGDMACGETGPGRLSEPAEIFQAIQAALHVKKGPLEGKSVLITAGPTHEPIDPVRYIANRSSGKQGYALAEIAASLGADVTLISGPTKLSPPTGVRFIEIETAREMRDATLANLPADIAICAAAVADWRVKKSAGQKMKKSKDGLPVLDLAENPDILASLSDLKDNRPKLLIGFAAETETIIDHAKKKLKKKGCDWIVANDVSAEGNVFGNDDTSIHIITKESVESFEKVTKGEAARHVLLKAAETLK